MKRNNNNPVKGPSSLLYECKKIAYGTKIVC